MKSKSLWLFPGKEARINLRKRFKDYPYFSETLHQFENLQLPNIVTVTWQPLDPLLRSLEGDEDEIAMHEAWIKQVKEWMKEGADIPPVLLDQEDVADGRHRTWAADELGIKSVPVVDLTKYWR